LVEISPDASLHDGVSAEHSPDNIIQEAGNSISERRGSSQQYLRNRSISMSSSGDKSWKKFLPSPDGRAGQPVSKSNGLQSASSGNATKQGSPLVGNASLQTAELVDSIDDDDPFYVEPAMKRKMDWTPVKDSALLQTAEPPSTSDEASEQVLEPSKPVFETLLNDFGFKKPDMVPSAPGEPVGADVLGKRKLVNMVMTNESKTPEQSPTKSKALKKKPRTITELATAAYRVPEAEDTPKLDQPTITSMLNSLETEIEATTANGKKTKRAAKPRVSKKKRPAPPVLLSPESALRQVSSLDFVFGTSSQLAGEQNIKLPRDLHDIMRASNEEADDTSATPVGMVLGKPIGKNLWTAGARNMDGDLLQAEVIDLATSPEIPKDLTSLAVIKSLGEPSLPEGNQDGEQIKSMGHPIQVVELSSSPLVANLKSTFFATPDSDTSSQVPVKSAIAVRNTQVEAVRKAIVEHTPPASNQEQNQLVELAASQDHNPRPHYELYTDAQLAKEIKGYGFKPIKRRTAMIALLDQCWSSKNGAKGPGVVVGSAALSTSATQSKATAAVAAPKRGRPKKKVDTVAASESQPGMTKAPAAKIPRGRPRKDSATAAKSPVSRSSSSRGKTKSAAKATASTTPRKRKQAAQEVVEIPDSESDGDLGLLSSPSIAASEPENILLESPEPADLSIGEDTEISLAASPTDQQAALFSFITKAVTTAPRSTNPLNPSWHEKMLMYDPIVLEDLSAWLNSGQLDRVGYDAEVAPGDVKKWCESKSVCCLWRVNLHGKERKRF
jgi:hypothetical protein